MAEILYSPVSRPTSLEVNVPRPKPEEAQDPADGDGNYLQEHLLQTRERILDLRGAFQGLQEPPRLGQTPDSERRGTVGSAGDHDLHSRLLTVLVDGESSGAGSKGLSINVLV